MGNLNKNNSINLNMITFYFYFTSDLDRAVLFKCQLVCMHKESFSYETADLIYNVKNIQKKK
jgi:hypothetical protein